MEVKAKLIDSVNASASVSIDTQSLQNEVQNLAKKAAKTIKMDGFRPGKVPASAVVKRYGKDLENDATQNLIKKALDEALKELKKDSKELVGEPYFEKFDKDDKELKAELVLSFKPQIDLSGYEKFIPEYATPKVTKKELDDRKENVLKSFATNEEIKEKRGLKKGDFALFDFEGFMDGKAFDGGKGENFTLEIGSNQFIPGFEDAMIGLKAEEEKDIQVRFPKDYGVPSLADKEATFKLKIHKILELKVPELNEDLLKKLLPESKEPSENELDEKLKKQIRDEKIYKLINDELKAKFADALVENFDFDLPKGVVEQETDLQFRSSLNSLSQEELKALQEDKEKAKEKRESFKDEAKKSVKLTFIVNELALLRQIAVSDQEVVQAVYFEAYRSGMDPRTLLQNYQKQGILPAVKMALLEDKLFNNIFAPKEESSASKKDSTAEKKTSKKQSDKTPSEEK